MKLSLRLTHGEILAARDEYIASPGEMARENKALAAGDRIAGGDLNPNHLDPIVDWKSSRPKRQIKSNDPGDITEALRVATTARHDRTAVAALCGLRGVNVSMASAILTAINRERFTVVDWRALKTLDVEKSWLTIDDYLDYLAYCRTKAKEHGVSLRDFDRALWIVGGQ